MKSPIYQLCYKSSYCSAYSAFGQSRHFVGSLTHHWNFSVFSGFLSQKSSLFARDRGVHDIVSLRFTSDVAPTDLFDNHCAWWPAIFPICTFQQWLDESKKVSLNLYPCLQFVVFLSIYSYYHIFSELKQNLV